MIRLVFVLRRREGLGREAFQERWREHHGPLVASHATRLRILRYVQLHTLDDPMNEQMAAARGGMEPPYDGVAELWWRSREDLVAVLESPQGQAAAQELLADEHEFIDLERSPLWLAHELPQVNPSPESLVASPDSPLVKLFFCLRHPSALSLRQAQRYWRVQHGPLIRAYAAAMRVLRYIQVHRDEDEIEAALRQARGTAVETYTGHAELWLERGAALAPEGERGAALAVEDEARFIDFERSAMWLGKERLFIDRR